MGRAVQATCAGCGQDAVLVLDSHDTPTEAYHPYTIDLVANPCPLLLPIGNSAFLSSRIPTAAALPVD